MAVVSLVCKMVAQKPIHCFAVKKTHVSDAVRGEMIHDKGLEVALYPTGIGHIKSLFLSPKYGARKLSPHGSLQ